MIYKDGDIVTFKYKDGSIWGMALGEVCDSTTFSFVIRDLMDGKRYAGGQYQSIRPFWIQIGDRFTFGSKMYPDEWWEVSNILWDIEAREYYMEIIDDSGEVTDYVGIGEVKQQNEIHFIDEITER